VPHTTPPRPAASGDRPEGKEGRDAKKPRVERGASPEGAEAAAEEAAAGGGSSGEGNGAAAAADEAAEGTGGKGSE
jgi:hypothetical protein